MIGRDDPVGEMRTACLDRDTADRLLAGRVEPDDAPPGYAHVASLLKAASHLSLAEPGREKATIAAMAEEIRSRLATTRPPTPRRFVVKRLFRAKLVGIVIGATLVGTTGLAFAGGLPGAAQGIASVMLAKVGITVPGPSSHAGTHPDTRGQSASHLPAAAGSQPTNTKGSQISNLARTTTATGVAKGAVISTVASGGKSRAGQPARERRHGPTLRPRTLPAAAGKAPALPASGQPRRLNGARRRP